MTAGGRASRGRSSTGARGASPIEAAIFNQEQGKFDVSPGVFAVGIGMVGPTLIAHGTPEQKERYLDTMLRGEEVWCQLFSEPGAGSDLAGLGTRAVRDGDEWVVNGQKVWNSGAHYSDWGILLARTDPSQPKHRGITYFLVDMRTPGIDVRPLRQITGQAHFNEVFLTDVRIPVANVVGDVNQGWRVAQTTLANERTLIGGGAGMGWRRPGRAGPRHWRRRVTPASARSWPRPTPGSSSAATSATACRRRSARAARPARRARSVKLFHSQHLARTGDLVVTMQGPAGTLADPDAPERRLLALVLPQPVGQPHRRRHRPDPAQHHRRAGPRPAPRAERRPRGAVQRAQPARVTVHLDETAEQQALRKELRAYFEALMTPRPAPTSGATGEGTPPFRVLVRQMGRDGWLGIGWPVEYGGQGRPATDQFIFFDEVQRAEAPFPFVTVNTVGPTLMRFGTEEQKGPVPPGHPVRRDQLRHRLHRAGSRHRPRFAADPRRRDGDEYVIDGAKVFTSGANQADYVWLACRTDPGRPQAQGHLHHPGADGVARVQLDADRHGRVGNVTTATFYDDVRVPVDNLVGGENEGWRMITNQLNHERVGLAALGGRTQQLFEDVVRVGATRRPRHRDRRNG